VQSLLPKLMAARVEGIVVRGVTPGDLGPDLYYLSRAAFGLPLAPASANESLFTGPWGEGVAERTAKAFARIEEASDLLQRDAPEAGLPEPDALLKHYRTGQAPPAWIKAARDLYAPAYEDLLRSLTRSRTDPGKSLFRRTKRLEFALAYLDCVEALCLAGQARAKNDAALQTEQLEKALEAIYNALTAQGEAARDPSDRGAIAVLNEFGYRAIKAEVERLESR
jgi:hypothetical protein